MKCLSYQIQDNNEEDRVKKKSLNLKMVKRENFHLIRDGMESRLGQASLK